jgi:hypothetical protein
MRHLIVLLMALALIAGLSAQPVITNADMAPAGTTFFMALDTLADGSIDPGATGGNKLWDFTALDADEQYQHEFMLPQWTPYSEEFPFASMAIYLGDIDAYAYFNRNNDQFALIGLVGEYEDYGLMTAEVEPKEIYLDFPVQYGDSREETFFVDIRIENDSPPGDSLRLKETTNKTTNVDGWGSLSIPLGSFDVLRIYEQRLIVDSIWVKMFGTWVFLEANQKTVTRYLWVSDDDEIGYTLATMYYDPESQTVDKVEFINGMPVGMPAREAKNGNVWPNPFSRQLAIDFPSDDGGEATISDMQGRVVARFVSNSQRLRVDMGYLPGGMYIYSLTDVDGKPLGNGKLFKQ